MKKKIVLCLLLGCLTSALFGCSTDKAKEALSAKTESEESEAEDEDEEEDTQEEEEKESKKKKKAKEAEEESEEEEADDKKSKDDDEDDEEDADDEKKNTKKKKSSGAPVLGDEDIEDYDGFEYLYGELLMTDAEENKKTGKMERHKLTVFIPEDDYCNVSGNRAYVTSMGLTMSVELNPYIRYDAEDYLMEENLELYIENTYDPFYTSDYKDMVISEVEEVGDNAYRVTVEYCEYMSWEEDYTTVFATYYYTELESGATVLVSTVVDESEVTGKTPRLIAELEEFYQFEIDWDADRAQQKREDYLASGGDHVYSTGYLLFELPENWDEVTENVDYDENVYAPEGDVNFSGCMISFYKEYLGYDEELDVTEFVTYKDETEAMLEESLGMEVSNFDTEICDTCLGEAAKISYTATEDGLSGDGQTYFVTDGYYVYTIQAFKLEDATEDPFIVLDGILQNAQVRE